MKGGQELPFFPSSPTSSRHSAHKLSQSHKVIPPFRLYSNGKDKLFRRLRGGEGGQAGQPYRQSRRDSETFVPRPCNLHGIE